MKKHSLSCSAIRGLFSVLCCTAAAAFAADGIAVTNFYTCGDQGGWALTSGGPLYKFEIINDAVVSNTKLYDGVAWSAVISQEGDRVAFLRGDGMICVMPISGGAPLEVVRQGGTGKMNINWPKGNWIYFMESGDEKDRFYKANIDTKEKVFLFYAPNGNTSFWISADAKRGCSRLFQMIWRHEFAADIVDSTLQYTKCAAQKCSGITQCGNGISPSGNLIMCGLYGDAGMDIKRFENNELLLRYWYEDTRMWPGWPETHSYSGGHCVIEKYSANSDDWVCQRIGEKMTLYNIKELKRIDVTNTAYPDMCSHFGDFWVRETPLDESKSYITPAATDALFMLDAQGNVTPSSFELVVTNPHTGVSMSAIEIEAVDISQTSGAQWPSWLSKLISGSGNNQKISFTVDKNSASEALAYSVPLIITAANAQNRVRFNVSFLNKTLNPALDVTDPLQPGVQKSVYLEKMNLDIIGTPSCTKVMPRIEIDSSLCGHARKKATVVYEGYLDVPYDDDYAFNYAMLYCEAMKMRIDGETVFDEQMAAWNTSVVASMALKKGLHSIRLAHDFTGDGWQSDYTAHGSFKLFWEGTVNPVAKSIIPSSALFCKRTDNAAPVQILSPNTAGQAFRQGSTMTIKWYMDDARMPGGYMSAISFGSDKIVFHQFQADTFWNNSSAYTMQWTIPDSIVSPEDQTKKFSTLSDSVWIQICDYSSRSICDIADYPVAIVSHDALSSKRSAKALATVPSFALRGAEIIVHGLTPETQAAIYTPAGRKVAQLSGKSGALHKLHISSNGYYIFEARTGPNIVRRSFLIR